MTKYIDVSPEALATLFVKSRKAEDLTLEEAEALINWCNCQTADLWDSMTLQECLNVYRVSAEWDTWEGWSEEERAEAHKAWNRAVIDPANKMMKAA